MWKKGLLLMLGAVLALSLTACAGNGDGASSQAGTDSSQAGEARWGNTGCGGGSAGAAGWRGFR